MPKKSAQFPTFIELLETDTAAVLPSSAKDCSIFLTAMQASFDHGRTSEARAARLELAAAILWAQAMRDDPDPHFIKLPDGHRRLLIAGLQLDIGLLKKPTWPTAVVRRAVAFMAPGGSPTKKPKAGSERGRGQQLSKSGVRRAAAPSGDEEDSDEALAPRRRSGDAAPIPLRKDRSEKTSAPKRRHSLALSDEEGDSDDVTALPSPRRSPKARGRPRSVARRESSSSNSSCSSDSDSVSSASSSSSAESSDHSGLGSAASKARRRSLSTTSKSSRRLESSASSSAPKLELTDKPRIRTLCGLPWRSGEDLQENLPPRWYHLLHTGRTWTTKQLREYEKTRSKSKRNKGVRREDPSNPAWVHRLSFIYGGDDTLLVDAANLARLVKGESRADFVHRGSTDHRAQQAYDAHLRDMKVRYGRVSSAFAQSRLPDELEVQDLCESLLDTLSRRFLAMRRALSSRGRSATEVLANTARQYHEVRKYIRSLRTDLGQRSKELSDRDERSQFIGGRLGAFLQPAVEQVLALETYDADKDALSLSQRSSRRADQPSAATSPSAKRLRSDSQPSAPAATPAATPGPGPCFLPGPLFPGHLVAHPFGAQPFAPSPWSGPFFPPPVPPALPPPTYQPPAAAAKIAAAPTTPAAAPAPAAKRRVTYADGATPGGAPARAAHMAQSLGTWTSAKGYLGLPAHAWVCGARAAPPLPAGTQSFPPRCGCIDALGFPGPHATWDCPLRYYIMRGPCPGFLADGRRDPAAWIGDEISDETRKQWLHYVSAHDGLPALSIARSASTGPPKFD